MSGGSYSIKNWATTTDTQNRTKFDQSSYVTLRLPAERMRTNRDARRIGITQIKVNFFLRVDHRKNTCF